MAEDLLAGVVSPARAAQQVKTTAMSAAILMLRTLPQIRDVNLYQPPTEVSQTLPPGRRVFARASGDWVAGIPAHVKFEIPRSELLGRVVAAGRSACVPWAR